MRNPPSGSELDKMRNPPSGSELDKMSNPPSCSELDRMNNSPSGSELYKMSKPPSGSELDKMSNPPSGSKLDDSSYRISKVKVSGYIGLCHCVELNYENNARSTTRFIIIISVIYHNSTQSSGVNILSSVQLIRKE